MAPSPGALLVPKALRLLRNVLHRANEIVKGPKAQANLRAAVPVRVRASPQTSHPIALLQRVRNAQASRNRLFSSQAQHASQRIQLLSRGRPIRQYQTSRVLAKMSLSPFTSALRPHLTGGVLPRSTAGYGLSGLHRARPFSHTATCQAQVVQNVNAGIRAFFVQAGQTKHKQGKTYASNPSFLGISGPTSSAIQERVSTLHSQIPCKGTTVNFHLPPSCLSIIATIENHSGDTFVPARFTPTTISNTLRVLSSSASFEASVALRSVFYDIQRLSIYGDLAISPLVRLDDCVLSVRFPGCSSDHVGRLCDEAGVTRGMIIEEEEADGRAPDDTIKQLAFRFPVLSIRKVNSIDQTRYNQDGQKSTDAELDYRSRGTGSLSEKMTSFLSRSMDIDSELMNLLSISSRKTSSNQSETASDIQVVQQDDTSSFASINTPYASSSSISRDVDALSASSFNDNSHGSSQSGQRAQRQRCRRDHQVDQNVPLAYPLNSDSFDGVEGIYRFLRICDNAAR